MQKLGRYAKSKRCRELFTVKRFSRGQVFFGCLVALWVLHLGGVAVRRPDPVAERHSRSLLAASTVKGRLDANEFKHHSPESLRAIVRSAISPGYKDRLLKGSEGEVISEYDPTFKYIESLAAEIVDTEQRVSCPWDSTLEADLPQLRHQKYLLAANFHNNEELLPHVIIQLWHLLAILPEGSAFVSIYESGSTDSTGAWLEVLRQMIDSMGVPHRIVIGGAVTREQEQDRIDFLARVRNAALEPLWLDSQAAPPENSTSWFKGLSQAKSQRSMWPADRVIFFNDVYFCAKDAIRLLLHEADMACGMDFDRRKLDQVPLPVQQKHLVEYMRERYRLPKWIGWIMSQIPAIIKSQAGSQAANERFRRDLPLGFYDLWVGRDINGAMFLKDEPYATDPYTVDRLPQGLPFPVKCCWNGLVAMNAKPFTEHSLKMRAHKKDECAASECSLMCNDFIRLGYQKLVVDPGVRQAYAVEDVRRLYNPEHVKGIKLTNWADVTRAPPVDSSLIPFRPFSQCCGLKPGNDMVDFQQDCGWENIMLPNFTAPDYPPRSRNYTRSTAWKPWGSKKTKLNRLVIKNVDQA